MLNTPAVLLYQPVLLILGPGIKAGCIAPAPSLVPACLPSSATVFEGKCTGRYPDWFTLAFTFAAGQ